MPDDQFATEVRPIGAHLATTTRDALAAPRSINHGHVPTGSTLGYPDEGSLRNQQERWIQNTYRSVVGNDQIADSSASATLYRLAKRALDISLALPALILFAPLMLIIAGIIRLDSPGPALFRQQRVGMNGRLFCMYKFRSMKQNAGVLLRGAHKEEHDRRVTKVGRFIRKTSLDELPQLINVILGHMSLVGPRPELPEIMLYRYEPWQYRRLSVPQGITGWWQVTGRGKKVLWKHTADDLYYVDRASIWFDLKLLFMTLRAVIGRDGAF
jgi:lipopolysaccharide/colanic/teichoic acid biosynthesis glycosyltransferase